MSSRVLAFPTSPTAKRPSPVAFLKRSRAFPTGANGASIPGPCLIHSRSQTADSQTQAERIALQVEQELAYRVQRETAQRHAAHRLPSLVKRRALASTLPRQATEVGLRHRILDALLFFARPA